MRMLMSTSLLAVLWAATCLAESPSEPLVRDLQSELPAVRRQAALALGRLADRAAAPGLIAALGDSDPAVRREAAVSSDRRQISPYRVVNSPVRGEAQPGSGA